MLKVDLANVEELDLSVLFSHLFFIIVMRRQSLAVYDLIPEIIIDIKLLE